MIAYCGIICNKCPAYIATQKNDENEKKDLHNSGYLKKYLSYRKISTVMGVFLKGRD
jgi:hypothetical protein